MTRTIEQYTWSFNATCQYGWNNHVKNGSELHKATYYEHRSITKLPAQLVCAARVKATEALKSAFAIKKKVECRRTESTQTGGVSAGEVSPAEPPSRTLKEVVTCPESKRCSIRYDARSYSLWKESFELTLLTIKGRVKIKFSLAKYYEQYWGWNPKSADLLQDKVGRWWLHVVMETENPKSIGITDETVGVDLGIVTPAADSRGDTYGETRWKDIEDRTFELRRRLQSKGTKSAKRHLKKISGRQQRFRKDCDHVVSKRLVQSVSSGATLVFEDLTNIRGTSKLRKTQRRRLHGWSFAQFQAFVTYKAEGLSINVGIVDPRYTSQKCSQCGHIERGNRPSQAKFKCKKCGFECHADLNAAINIREDFLKRRASVNVPIVVCPEMGS